MSNLDPTMIPLLNVIASLLLIIFSGYVARRRNTLLDVGILFSVNIFICYPLRIMTLYVFGREAGPQYPGLLENDALVELSQIQLFGILGFIVGYFFSITKRPLPISQKKYLGVTRRDILFFWTLFVFSLLAKIYKITTGNYISFLIGRNVNYGFANTIENIHNMGWLCFAAVWVVMLLGRQKNKLFYSLFIAVNLVQIGYQIFQGSKTFLLLPFLIIIFAIYYAKHKIPIFSILLLLVFAVTFVFPFVAQFRENVNTTYGEIPEFSEFSVVEFFSGSPKKHELNPSKRIDSESGILNALKRFDGADELYNLDRLVPRILPYKLGKDFYSILVTPIPRAIWPDKPIFSPGAEYGKILGTTTSITPFPFGEMLWNFGMLGLFPAMMFWGFFLGQLMTALNRLFFIVRFPLFVVSIFLSELYWVTTGEAMLAILMSSMMKKAIIFFFTYQLVSALIGLVVSPANSRNRKWSHARETV